LMLSQVTPLTMLRLKFKIKKVSLPINKDWSLLESNLKMEEHCRTTIFRKNQHSTWFSDSEEETEAALFNHPSDDYSLIKSLSHIFS
jgi:hypothetical protein